jgi:hypothetical protein
MTKRFRPFVSPSLDAYTKRYWALLFTIGSRPLQTAEIRHLVGWYCTRLKVVSLDHHIHREELRRQLVLTAKTAELPLLFINGKLVGDLAKLQELERDMKLKDVLHFGFEWKTGTLKDACGPLPSAFGDDELFRARYRGTPPVKPVVQLPSLHPFFSLGE